MTVYIILNKNIEDLRLACSDSKDIDHSTLSEHFSNCGHYLEDIRIYTKRIIDHEVPFRRSVSRQTERQ